jgi:hypothetical protein
MEDNLFPAGSFKDTDMKNKTFKEMVEPWEPSPKIGREHAERFPEDIKKIEPKGSKYHK